MTLNDSFSSKEHQATDWQGVHVKICQLLVPLRTPTKVLGSEDERNRREKNIQKIQVCFTEINGVKCKVGIV